MQEPKVEGASERLRSVDAYRGFVMLAMASGGLRLHQLAEQKLREQPGSGLWRAIGFHTDHVAWTGCSFWDLIQPSFMFLVGVAMPFSYARRRARGESWGQLFRHAAIRSIVLVLLGIFLQSRDRTDFTFFNVLEQIGLGYLFVFLALGLRPGWQLLVALLVLAADWGLFAAYPIPGLDFRSTAVGLDHDWPRLPGFLAHWEKNMNVAAAFDRRFLNLFPREYSFKFNPGGYTTLNFVPSIATMLFGVLAGEWLRARRGGATKVLMLLVAGAAAMAAGTALDVFGVVPIVKRIWTPSWVLYSTGWTCWMLAAFFGVIDVLGPRRWAFPLVVVGTNSIAMYVMAQLLKSYVAGRLHAHFGGRLVHGVYRIGDDSHGFLAIPPEYAPVAGSAAVLLVLWLVCFWLYRSRIFLKI